MSSFLCFICHNTVHLDTTDETRDKYREVVGINLCPDSHLCYICCHMLNKLWLFKSACLKRSLEYSVIFSEKGTFNLQMTDIESIILCSEENCMRNDDSHVYVDNRDQSVHSNDYLKLEYEQNDYYPETIKYVTETDTIQDFENKQSQFENNDKQFDNHDEQFDKSDEQFDNNDEQFDKSDEQFEQNDEQFDKNDKQFDNDDRNDGSTCSTDGNVSDVGIDKVENDVDFECYDDEINNCLNEIRNESLDDEVCKEIESSKPKSKSKKKKKKDFEKILLTAEEQKWELEAQRKSKKYIEAEYKCYNCGLGFLFKDTYQAHMMRHEESNGEYRCALCSLRFATGAVLRSHAALHSVRYRCERCKQYIRARQTHTHAKYCHNVASAATCHLCGRVFQDASGLQQHLKRFHLTKKSNRCYSCNVCGKSYNNQAAVRTHMIKHVHRKFSCEQCDSTFSSPYTLTQHKKKHLPAAEDKQYFCSSCAVSYSSRKSLLAHMRNSVNHQQRVYECPVCNRTCPNERSLTSHMSTVHSASKPFRCPNCNASYSSRKSLVRHVRAHTVAPQPKLAVCHICGNSFKGKSKLNRHLREVCEKDKLEEELALYYEQDVIL